MFKEGNRFYYILPRYFEIGEENHKEFRVFAYQYHEHLNHCFNQDLMFKTKKEAEKKCKLMNRTEGY